jgi:hypothetical protein
MSTSSGGNGIKQKFYFLSDTLSLLMKSDRKLVLFDFFAPAVRTNDGALCIFGWRQSLRK